MLPYIALGMGIGALLHGVVPRDYFLLFGDMGMLGVVLAAVLGVGLYVRAEMVIPLGLVLIEQQVPLGVVMSFLIAGAGCSLPELILLRSMFQWRMLGLFVLMVLGVAVGFGLMI